MGGEANVVAVETGLAWESEDSEEALMEKKGLEVDCLRRENGDKSGGLGTLRTPTMAFGMRN